MKEDIINEMRNYLENASDEQLAEDYQEIINNHDGPLAFGYIESQLKYLQDKQYERKKANS